MKKKFSKGKWVISDDTSECFMIESEDGVLICTVHDGSFDDDAIHMDVVEANAKLIAAAPEMIDILSTIENDNGEIPDWLWKRIKDVIKNNNRMKLTKINSMKTIEEAANDYVKNKYKEFALLDIIGEDTSINDLRNDFIAGAEFAQQFINIEDEKPEYYEPVIIELQNGGVIAWRGWSEIYGDTYTINGTDIYLMAKEVKRWRPINFK